MTTATAKLTNQRISTKASLEIASHLRGKNTEDAKVFLEAVLKKEKAVPFKRFTDGVGHKKGMAAGRYPAKASQSFLTLIKSVEANAENQDLFGPFTIEEIKANKGPKQRRYSRNRGRTHKNTHLEITVKETE